MSAKSNTVPLKQQLVELNELLEWFDQPDIDIEEAIAKFKEASKLAAAIEKRVSGLKNEVTVLKQSFEQDR
ncbi:MAG TPA: exodeoxyribonuclease VII small subunit [Candidatus Saccharimonadales bacterium]